MAENTRKLSFAAVRLNDLSDDYGFGDDLDMTIISDEAVEEAQEAGSVAHDQRWFCTIASFMHHMPLRNSNLSAPSNEF
ncbi:unnamed protein product [Nippostrongylus brasiliensis]|uniref:Uncharacterized protein n=1 Tax=Nippostrongylus brasiliensis TaxID=27835 RepID=A0A158QZD2_NIPBR|nr:unnamed protein product [Nippostrongylus brasiliensis]